MMIWHKFDLKWDWDKYPCFVLGCRGYYPSMGQKGINDVGIYDDAAFIIGQDFFESYNFNTDPSALKYGRPFLKEGVSFAYKLDLHQNRYAALCQRLGPVDVLRYNPNGPAIEDKGNFGINIHSGASRSTNSEGCHTVPPYQYPFFMSSLILLDAKGRKDGVIPYVLINE